MTLARPIGKLATVEARKPDIRKKQIDRLGLQHPQRRSSIRRCDNFISKLLQQARTVVSYVSLILDDQDTFARDSARFTWHGGLAGDLGFRRCQALQIEFDRRALPEFAIDLDVASGLLDKPIHHAQPEPAAAALALCREEGLERRCADLLGHPAAGIGYREHDVLTWPDLVMYGRIVLVEVHIRCFNRQSS